MKPTIVKLNLNRRSFTQASRLLTTLAMLIMLYGCPAVGPDYVRPEVDSPDAWHSTLQEGLTTTVASPSTLARWWTTLNDPLLSNLMKRAMAGNLDLQTAQARVREARARRGISQGGYFPSLDANGAYSKNYTSESAALGQDRESELYSAGLDAGWEIDVFGGVRRSVEAADADLAASLEDLNGTLVSLLAEIALNYIDVRTLQARLNVAQANIKALEETYQLTNSRYKAGLSDELAVQGARYALAGTRAQIPTLTIRLESALNRLAVLVGKTPGTVHQELIQVGPIPVPPLSIAVGVPADTLRNRPDVRKAERQLAAQTARIGVAKSDLYPKFSLLGTLGYQSLTSDDLFDSANLTYRYGPSISWRLFSGGAVFQNIEVQNARQEQALKQYHATVLGALEEAENALTAYIGEQARRDALIIATKAATQAFHLARDQYQAGLVDFSVVLVAQQSMLSYQDQLAQSEGTVTINLVRLYKSLGGGWTAQINDTKSAGSASSAGQHADKTQTNN